jgi:hypothetical protein
MESSINSSPIEARMNRASASAFVDYSGSYEQHTASLLQSARPTVSGVGSGVLALSVGRASGFSVGVLTGVSEHCVWMCGLLVNANLHHDPMVETAKCMDVNAIDVLSVLPAALSDCLFAFLFVEQTSADIGGDRDVVSLQQVFGCSSDASNCILRRIGNLQRSHCLRFF